MRQRLMHKNAGRIVTVENDTKPGAVWVEGRCSSVEEREDIRENRGHSASDAHSVDGFHGSLPEGSSLDADVLDALPIDIRHEIIEQEIQCLPLERQDVTRSQAERGAAVIPEESDLDPDVLAALPEDIRCELIEQEVQFFGAKQAQRKASTETVVSIRRNKLNTKREEVLYNGELDSFGQRHGEGRLRWRNGDTFHGAFENGLRNGIGTLTLSDGFFYSGGWKDDKFDGCGTRRFPSGCTYTGIFQNGQCNGHGRCVFPNGDSYIGQWKDGLMDGRGSYVYSHGDVYEGMHRSNKQHGPGQYRSKDGKLDVMRYVEGMRIGFGVRWSSRKRKAWLLKGTEIIRKVTSKEAELISKQVLADLDNTFTEDLSYHTPCKEKKRFNLKVKY